MGEQQMAKNSNVYKFDVIEKIIGSIDFKTKEEVVELAKKMSEIASQNPEYSKTVKNAFKDACTEIENELTLDNMKEIKKIINNQ